jgi:hypothetical protein
VVLCIPTQIRREVAEKWVGTATAFERYRAYEGAARLKNPADLAQRVFDRSEVIETPARHCRRSLISISTNWPASSRRAALDAIDSGLPHRDRGSTTGSTSTPAPSVACAMEALAPGAGPLYGLGGRSAPPAPLGPFISAARGSILRVARGRIALL